MIRGEIRRVEAVSAGEVCMEYQTTGEKRFGLGELPSDAVNYVGGINSREKAETAVPSRSPDDDSRIPRKVVKSN